VSYVNADVVIICYSISRPESLENVLERWLPEVRHFCPNCPVILAGNKVDLRPSDVTSSVGNPVPVGDDVGAKSRDFRPEYVSSGRGESVAEQVGALRFVECSAKNRHGVRDVFLAAATSVVKVRPHRRRHKQDNCTVL